MGVLRRADAAGATGGYSVGPPETQIQRPHFRLRSFNLESRVLIQRFDALCAQLSIGSRLFFPSGRGASAKVSERLSQTIHPPDKGPSPREIGFVFTSGGIAPLPFLRSFSSLLFRCCV
jgi:hypothetical protein